MSKYKILYICFQYFLFYTKFLIEGLIISTVKKILTLILEELKSSIATLLIADDILHKDTSFLAIKKCHFLHAILLI